MPSPKWSLITSIFFALALVYHSAMSVFHSMAEDDEPASVPSLSTKMTDVILVSYEKPWNEAHASFARLLGGPIMTGRVEKESSTPLPFRTIPQFRKPVLVLADPAEPFEILWKRRRGARWHSTWLFVRHHSEIRTLITSSWWNRSMPFAVGVLGMNSTAIKSIFWPRDLSTDHNPGSKEMLAKLRIPNPSNVNPLNGKQLTVRCIKHRSHRGIHNSCDGKKVKQTLMLLTAINVTVKRSDKNRSYEEWGVPDSWSILFTFDIGLRPELLAFFDIPLFLLRYDTFYSRVDCHRAITLSEAAGESSMLVATTVFLLAVVAVVSLVVGEKGWSALRRFSDAAMFLLAAVLGTSAVQPNVACLAAVPRKALLGLWLLAILPLSVYFRSELTSILTLTRPPYRIDALQKLEDALDRNEVAPCVVKGSNKHGDLLDDGEHFVNPWPLMNKLQVSFAKHGARSLVKENTSACLQCALRRDRVCLSSSNNPSPFPNKCPNVREFLEPFRMEWRGFLMIKFHELYEPLKRIFLAAQERGLIDRDDEPHDYGNADNQFDVSGLFMLQLVLHAASCLVLALEILVAWCLRRMEGCRSSEAQDH